MIVKNASNLAGLLDFVLRKSQGGGNQTLTIVSQSKNTSAGHGVPGNGNQSIGPQNQGVNKCFV